jgi:hypothetical protein
MHLCFGRDILEPWGSFSISSGISITKMFWLSKTCNVLSSMGMMNVSIKPYKHYGIVYTGP